MASVFEDFGSRRFRAQDVIRVVAELAVGELTKLTVPFGFHGLAHIVRRQHVLFTGCSHPSPWPCGTLSNAGSEIYAQSQTPTSKTFGRLPTLRCFASTSLTILEMRLMPTRNSYQWHESSSSSPSCFCSYVQSFHTYK